MMMILRYQPLSAAPSRHTSPNGGQQPWAPAADFAETKQEYLLTLDLPGVAEQDVEVRFHEGALSVQGHRTTPSEGVTRRERQTGPFRRNFRLAGAIDPDRIQARFDRGVLEIRVPKLDRSRKIVIQ